MTKAGATTYSYNPKNQTTAIGGTTFDYADADSTERTAAGGTSYVNGLLGVTRQSGGTAGLSFTREPDGTLVSLRVDRTGGYDSHYYTLDAQGSVLQLTDPAGATSASYCYDPYGVAKCASGALAGTNPFRYASGQADGTGLTKFGTRYYDPGLGRWTQRDPVAGTIANPGTVNRYPYVGNSPTNRIDASGRGWECNGAFIVSEVTIGIVLGIAGATGGLGLVAGLVLATAFTVTLGIVNGLTC